MRDIFQEAIASEARQRIGDNGRVARPNADREPFRPYTIGRRVSEIERREVRWLWRNRLALGRINAIVGDGGLGKSYASLAIAATVSRGSPWPDGVGNAPGPSDVIILNSEDDPEEDIAPRLFKCGADLGRVHLIEGIQRAEDGDPCFTNLSVDLQAIEDKIVETSAKLVVIDPIGSYLGNVDSHKDAAVRSVLGPVNVVARRNGCAVIVIIHFNKTTGAKVGERFCGSVAFRNITRMSWTVMLDPNDENRRLFQNAKTNITGRTDGLAFTIDNDGLRWLAGVVTETADQTLEEEQRKSQTAKDDAADWLVSILATGAMLSDDIKAAAEKEGHSMRTINRAKKDIGIRSRRNPADGRWSWELALETPEGKVAK